jgi:CspA family cold shock protein
VPGLVAPGFVAAFRTGNSKWQPVPSSGSTTPKAFGFITPSEGGEDLFAHHTAIQMSGFKTLKEGQKVEFEVKRGPKGLQAHNIKPL